MINKVAKHIRQGTLANAVYKKAMNKKIRRNIYNITRYGWEAPRVGERIWIYPNNNIMVLGNNKMKETLGLSYLSAIVVENMWPIEQAKQITEISLIKFCIDHWVNGVPWEETGEYERMELAIKKSKNGRSHGCKTREDIIKRCENLDRVFEQAKEEGRLRTPEEINSSHWGSSEININIGPKGKLFKGGNGMHRFGIAYILQIPFPAQIGCVHVSAIPYLKEYRKG